MHPQRQPEYPNSHHFLEESPFIAIPSDLLNIMFIMEIMSSEFDWFMITMPIFALVVFAIVMVGSMKATEVSRSSYGCALLWGFGGMFGVGIVVSLYYMLLRFASPWKLLTSMPIYEFTCRSCSKDSEILVRSSAWEGHAQCPKCGSKELQKNLSVFSASSSDSTGGPLPELPPCSGMPSNCGRCSLD